jgi:hypothetical protein
MARGMPRPAVRAQVRAGSRQAGTEGQMDGMRSTCVLAAAGRLTVKAGTFVWAPATQKYCTLRIWLAHAAWYECVVKRCAVARDNRASQMAFMKKRRHPDRGTYVHLVDSSWRPPKHHGGVGHSWWGRFPVVTSDRWLSHEVEFT